MKVLSQLINYHPSKKQLLADLTPEVRTIHLDPISKEITLQHSIESILSLITNSIRYSQISVTLVLHVNESHQRKLFLPYYGNQRAYRESTKKVSILLTLLKIIVQRLNEAKISTVRDVFYSNVELFKEQRTVTYWLHVITVNFKLQSRDMINIIPAQKGLVFSRVPLYIYKNQSAKIECISDDSTNLIPYMDDTSVVVIQDLSLVENVIILEKEAVFNKFVTNTEISLPPKSIVVTGKGYPDNLTKVFLKKLMQFADYNKKKINFELYVDSDPDGVNIALNYMNHCNEIGKLNQIRYRGATLLQLIKKETQLINITSREIKIVQNSLYKEPNTGIRLQLQRQLFFNKKGEMNSLYL